MDRRRRRRFADAAAAAAGGGGSRCHDPAPAAAAFHLHKTVLGTSLRERETGLGYYGTREYREVKIVI